MSTTSPASRARGLVREALERALAHPGREVNRLRHCKANVSFHISGDESASATLLVDRAGCRVLAGTAPADVQISFSPEQAAAFACGRLPMTAAVVSGDVDACGPVRHYLEVDVIVRRLIELTSGTAGAGCPELRPARAPEHIDADLLAIETRSLHKSFGQQAVLTGLDLEIPEGVISVVLGPSGTGKSVCLQHIVGLMRPDAGDVVVRGRSVRAMHRAELLDLRRDIGVMFQDGALFSTMTVFDNVAFPLRQHTDFGEDEIAELVMDQLEMVGLASAADRMPHALSGGMRKRAGLARAMALNPGIVLCDEPDSGLDPVRTALLGDLLLDRHAAQGGTMVVVTHNVELARRIADHVSVLWRGQVLEAGMVDQVLDSDNEFVQQFLAGACLGPLGMDA
jgi:phospholipid/cholesterol/gamma-HCH transport system ATP-binding protein